MFLSFSGFLQKNEPPNVYDVPPKLLIPATGGEGGSLAVLLGPFGGDDDSIPGATWSSGLEIPLL